MRALLLLYAETPVHAGADTGSGVVDMPIQREVATGLPIIKGESLKGALREHFRDIPRWTQIFGSEPPRGGEETTPGSLRVHEAQLVAFPAPTMEDTFAWVTSPMAQARLARKTALAGLALPPVPAPQETSWISREQAGELVIGPYVAATQFSAALKKWAAEIAQRGFPDDSYFRAKFQRDLVCGGDDLLAAVSRDCAPVTARVQLGGTGDTRTKTVRNGPFYSEYLPGESLLAALLEGSPGDLGAVAALDGQVLRVGGDESIGKGLMWCRLWRPDDATAS
ncbi:type III-B CRISPR module RAMP protein Cmr4 [Acrocarpospora sp. B8E8]|uniref:type III-B CRISPR module RAMP protein Cmr4 n=1 Tax=Acrocarpospora sp. B8E8 TaxID=3153572 RepID=UPI00325F8789